MKAQEWKLNTSEHIIWSSICPKFYRCSMRALWVVRQTSQLSSISVHMLLHKLKVNAATAALSSQKSPAKWQPTVASIQYPLFTPRWKNRGSKVRQMWWSSDSSIPVNPFLWKLTSSITSLSKCGGDLSCWNSMSLGPSSFKIGMRNWLCLVCSITSWGLLFPQILRLCQLTFPDKWNVSSSMKTTLAGKSLSSSFEKKSQQNVYGTWLMQLHVTNIKLQTYLENFVYYCLWHA